MALSEQEKIGKLETLTWYQSMYVAKNNIDDDPNYYGWDGADNDRAKIKADALNYKAKVDTLMRQLLDEGVPSNEVWAAMDAGRARGESM